MSKRHLCVLGDSISSGIGKRLDNWVNDLPHLLPERGIEVLNWAKSGSTIDTAFDIYQNNRGKVVQGDIVVVFIGSVDLQRRPDIQNAERKHFFRFVPARYRSFSMIDPRPYYSKRLFKHLFQRLENGYRRHLKKKAVRLGGTMQMVSIEDFDRKYRDLVSAIIDDGGKPILLSTMFLDDHLFLGSNSEYKRGNQKIKRIANDFSVPFLDLFQFFEEDQKTYGWPHFYSYDHYHPNRAGLHEIAVLISGLVNEIIGRFPVDPFDK